MRSRIALAAALLLTTGACGGGTGATTAPSTTAGTTTTAAVTTTTTPPGFEVVSEDGDLTVEVPFEAAPTDPGITIRLLSGEEFPPELAAAADDPDVRIYELGPAGTEFAAPVRVTRRLDASRFTGMTPSMVPAVVLMTYDTTAGTYELYDDLRVVRDGGDVFISGETTHFSPTITVNIGGYVDMQLDDYHLGYKTELGSSLGIGYRYYDADLQSIDPPPSVEPYGYTRSVALEFGMGTAGDGFGFGGLDPESSTLDVMCDKTGAFRPRLGVRVGIDPDGPETGFRSNLISALIPSLERLELTMKIVADFYCLDPITSFLIALAVTRASFATDHPGGEEYITGGDYYGGNSGFKLTLPYVSRLEGAWAGLIGDNDRNGRVDATDTFFAPWTMMRDGENLTYVAPLYDYGDYFVYLADATQFAEAPNGQASWSVGAALQAFESKYTGTGRFETSIGILGVAGNPFVYQVGPQESQIETEVELRQVVTRVTFQF